MKTLSLIATLILTSATLLAQNDLTDDLEQPILKFETEVIDYGTIDQNSNGVREFKFTNTGSAPLVISNVESTCGCTVPSYSKEPIQPGKTGTIKVKYATSRLGAINKTITVKSNAARKSVVLRIKGKVLAVTTTPTKKASIPQVK